VDLYPTFNSLLWLFFSFYQFSLACSPDLDNLTHAGKLYEMSWKETHRGKTISVPDKISFRICVSNWVNERWFENPIQSLLEILLSDRKNDVPRSWLIWIDGKFGWGCRENSRLSGSSKYRDISS